MNSTTDSGPSVRVTTQAERVAPDGSEQHFLSGVMLAIAGTFLFALKSILIKFAFNAGADSTLLLMLRLSLSLPFYVGMLLYLRSGSFTGQPKHLERRHVAAATGLGFFGYYLASFLDMAGLERISAQLERLTLFTYPAMIAVLAWLFLGERMTRRIVASILLTYLGIVVMYSQEREAMAVSTNQTATGVFLVLGSALSYSVYVLLAKPLMQKMGSREFTSYAMIGSAVFIACHFFATRSLADLTSANPIVYVYSLGLAFVCTVIPSFLISEAIVRLGAARTTIIGSVGPVMTMMLAIFVLGEATSAQHIAGMLIVLLGVSFVAKK